MNEPRSRFAIPTDAEQEAAYRRAGIVYCILGLVILGLTVASPQLASPERRTDLIHLAVGAPFFFLFAWLIASGHRLFGWLARPFTRSREGAAGVGRWWREKLVMLLTLSALGRTCVFVLNGFGFRPRLRDGFQLESVAANPKMFVNAVLMAIILGLLARASWGSFLKRRREN